LPSGAYIVCPPAVRWCFVSGVVFEGPPGRQEQSIQIFKRLQPTQTQARLNARTALLGLFVALTIVLASTTVYESGTRTTLTSTSTSTSTLTSTSTSTSTVTTTSSLLTAYGFQFITESGICTANGVLAPCWGEPAYVFNCQSSLLTEPYESCSQFVASDVSAYASYSISVTSYRNQSEPWANCAYQAGFAAENGAYCVALNSTAFILGEPAPPPASTSGVQSSSVAGIQVPAASVSRLNSQTGLNLILNLSADANPYPTINITAYDVNSLGRANNLTIGNGWPIISQETGRGGGCCGALVEYVLYQGNYGLGNFTQGTPLRQIGGIATLAYDNSYCIFNPLSTQTTVYSAPGPFYKNPFPENASVSASLLGFWIGNLAHPEGDYALFPAGTYTVAAADQWGNVVLSHFTVQD
jgi:hypothetical protein